MIRVFTKEKGFTHGSYRLQRLLDVCDACECWGYWVCLGIIDADDSTSDREENVIGFVKEYVLEYEEYRRWGKLARVITDIFGKEIIYMEYDELMSLAIEVHKLARLLFWIIDVRKFLDFLIIALYTINFSDP